MASQRSCTSNMDDGFIDALNESLETQYLHQLLPSFVSELMKSINSAEIIDIEFFLNDNGSNCSFFRTSPLLFSDNETDTSQDQPLVKNERNSIDSKKQIDTILHTFSFDNDVEMLDSQSENVCKRQNVQSEQIEQAETSEMIWHSSKSKNCDDSVNVDETVLSSPSINSDNNLTYCEVYEIWRNSNFPAHGMIMAHTYQDVRPCSSVSTKFLGFSPAVQHLSLPLSSINRSDRDGDDNSTHCETYEQWKRDLSQMESINFNFEEAYAKCFLESQTQNSDSDRRKTLMEEIEKITLGIVNDLSSGRTLQISLPNKVTWANCVFDGERLSVKPQGDSGGYRIQSKRKFAMILYVLSFVYKLLSTNGTCTKREIYYRDPEFTQSQNRVDLAIRDVCIILDARPWELGILSSSKGLIAGLIKITLHDDKVIDVNSINGGILLPQSTTSIKKVETSAAFVLLVEKATVYERLLNENVLTALGKPCILVTGKGYPDINTRVILKRIWDDCKCPIYALVDADPYGIEIMLTYRHGSLAMSFSADELAVPSIQWIGVYPSEIKRFGLPCMPLTGEDTRKINDIIKRPYINKRVLEELLVLKTTMMKTEVEGLMVGHSINSYITKKIKSGISI